MLDRRRSVGYPHCIRVSASLVARGETTPFLDSPPSRQDRNMSTFSWRAIARRLSASARRGPQRVVLGRAVNLEDRITPTDLAGTLAAKQRFDTGPVLAAPAMPGLADLDPTIATAVRNAWKVAPGSTADKWLVALNAGTSPNQLAAFGVVGAQPVQYWANAYVVTLGTARDVAAFGRDVTASGLAAWFSPQIKHNVSKRADPLFADQWHLSNTGQTGGTAAADANVTPVWNQNITGTGVVIGVVDDGFEYTHPDLNDNAWTNPGEIAGDGIDNDGNGFVDDIHGFDFNGIDGLTPDGDPTPDATNFDFHGTSVSGVAASERDNSIGGRGAAYGAQIAGLRLIAFGADDQQESSALSYERDEIDIYSNSWGPADNGVLGPAGPLMSAALADSALNGRGGLGNIITWAAGNGLGSNDNVNYDGYANNPAVIAVGAIDHNGVQASYSEPGAPMLVTAYSSSSGGPGITTTDLVGADGYSTTDYADDFGGTSSATPLVSGVIALMLQANPNLTSRDVQNILVRTAHQNDAGDSDWTTNAAGYHINHKYGFGSIDAAAAVAMATGWTTVQPLESFTSDIDSPNLAIPDDDATGVTSTINVPTNMVIEHVLVHVSSSDHTYIGDLEIKLISPSGTESFLSRQHFSDGQNGLDWTYSTVRDWGETSAGDWRLEIRDLAAIDTGTFENWQLTFLGTAVALPPSHSDLEATPLDYQENQTLPITDIVTPVDSDGTDFQGATVKISSGFVAGEDQLRFTNQNGITGVVVGNTLTLSGTATIAQYQAALRSVQYRNLSEAPTTTVRTFSYQVTDSDGLLSNTVTRDANVTSVNDAPTFTVGPNLTVVQDSGNQSFNPWATNITPGPVPETGNVSFEIVSVSTPALFSNAPTVSATGVLTFTPAPGTFGSATVTLHVKDDGGTENGGVDTSADVSFTITVSPRPEARPDQYTLNEDGTLNVPAPGVKGNDFSPNGLPLTPIKLTDPTHGTLTFRADGSFDYVPVANFNGTDSFTYKVSDGTLDSAPGTVTIRVLAVNDPPTAVDDLGLNTPAGKPLAINVVGNDTDPDGDNLRVSAFTAAAHGRVSRSGSLLVYTPAAGYNGSDSFTYTVRDPSGSSDTGLVQIQVLDITPPKVTAARFRYGATGGRSLDLRSLSRTILPFSTLGRFEFTFSENVDLDGNELSITDSAGNAIALTYLSGPTTRTALWSVTAGTGLPIGRFNLRLDAAGVLDVNGNPMIGDETRSFAVLPGDVDGNGLVDSKDTNEIKKNYRKTGARMNRFADVNGDGIVDKLDTDLATANLGKRV